MYMRCRSHDFLCVLRMTGTGVEHDYSESVPSDSDSLATPMAAVPDYDYAESVTTDSDTDERRHHATRMMYQRGYHFFLSLISMRL
jgi:hypothetical protein